jgi:hypothetical protein
MSINTSSLLLRADEGDSIFLASGEFLTWKANTLSLQFSPLYD